MRLIDADALIKELEKDRYTWQDYDEVRYALQNVATITIPDGVEISPEVFEPYVKRRKNDEDMPDMRQGV